MNQYEIELIQNIMQSGIENGDFYAMHAIQGLSVKRQAYHDKWLKICLSDIDMEKNENGVIAMTTFIKKVCEDPRTPAMEVHDFIRLLDIYQLEYLYKEERAPESELFKMEESTERVLFIMEGCSICESGTPLLSAFFDDFALKDGVGLFLRLIHAIPYGVKIDKSLRVSGIIRLEIAQLGLTEIPFLDKLYNLEILNCSENQIEELNLLSNEKLLILDCAENNLGYLDLRRNKRLEMLICDENRLTHLNVVENIHLRDLSCSANEIENLDLYYQKGLISLICYCNSLEELNITENHLLEYLDCSYNSLLELNTTNNLNLEQLSLEGNLLITLDVSKNRLLTKLNIRYNEIEELDTSRNTVLTDFQ